MEKVSVVIPTHFRPDHLKNALASVVKQKWDNLEIIVVSDGFDEETDLYMNKIKLSDDRISYFTYEKIQGANYARNMGIRQASGKYVAFLDDDDVWHRDKITNQMKVMNSDEKIGIINCGVRSLFVETNEYYDNNLICEGDMSKRILYGNYIGSTSAVMVKRSALEQCGGFDESLPAMQDYDLWIRICQKYHVGTVKEIQLDYYNYNKKGSQEQISRSFSKYLEAARIIRHKYVDLFNCLSAAEKKAISASFDLRLAEQAIKTNNDDQVRKYALVSLKKKKTIKALYLCIFPWISYSLLIKIRGAKKCNGEIQCINT